MSNILKAIDLADRAIRRAVFAVLNAAEHHANREASEGLLGVQERDNAWPINNDRCCDLCNAERVIPALRLQAREAKRKGSNGGGLQMIDLNDIEDDSFLAIHASLRNFGLKVGMVGPVKFEARIRELVENLPDLVVLVEPLLIVRRVLREQLGVLHRRVLAVVRDHPQRSFISQDQPCT